MTDWTSSPFVTLREQLPILKSFLRTPIIDHNREDKSNHLEEPTRMVHNENESEILKALSNFFGVSLTNNIRQDIFQLQRAVRKPKNNLSSRVMLHIILEAPRIAAQARLLCNNPPVLVLHFSTVSFRRVALSRSLCTSLHRFDGEDPELTAEESHRDIEPSMQMKEEGTRGLLYFDCDILANVNPERNESPNPDCRENWERSSANRYGIYSEVVSDED
ncbi:unnamed protein product [Agarophyton chilense]